MADELLRMEPINKSYGRIQALEEAVARRERVFQRLMDMFSGFNTARQ